MFLSMGVKSSLTVGVIGKEVELSVCDIADGCVGVALLFDTKENAFKHNEKAQIVSVDYKE